MKGGGGGSFHQLLYSVVVVLFLHAINQWSAIPWMSHSDLFAVFTSVIH